MKMDGKSLVWRLALAGQLSLLAMQAVAAQDVVEVPPAMSATGGSVTWSFYTSLLEQNNPYAGAPLTYAFQAVAVPPARDVATHDPALATYDSGIMLDMPIQQLGLPGEPQAAVLPWRSMDLGGGFALFRHTLQGMASTQPLLTITNMHLDFDTREILADVAAAGGPVQRLHVMDVRGLAANSVSHTTDDAAPGEALADGRYLMDTLWTAEGQAFMQQALALDGSDIFSQTRALGFFIIQPPGPVPEPSTWSLMALGLCGLGVSGRLRRQGRAS